VPDLFTIYMGLLRTFIQINPAPFPGLSGRPSLGDKKPPLVIID